MFRFFSKKNMAWFMFIDKSEDNEHIFEQLKKPSKKPSKKAI